LLFRSLLNFLGRWTVHCRVIVISGLESVCAPVTPGPLPPARETSMSARRTRKDDGSQWTVADSRSVYGIRHWGAGYCAINDKGRVEVRPNGPQSTPIDLFEQVDELRSSGLSLPLLVRFPDILQDRVR